MATKTKIVVIADLHGRILAAQTPETTKSESKDHPPDALITPLEGQRAVNMEVPGEVMSLPGPDLHRYFSEVKIACNGEVQLPEIAVAKMHE